MIDRGMSLIEVLIVLTIGVLLLLPAMNFLIMTQKSSYKGLDRLETLTRARIVLEKAQRDLKNFCYTDAVKMIVATSSSNVVITFPSFPSAFVGGLYTGDENLANLVTYTFDRQKKVLTRSLRCHPRIRSDSSPQSEILATNVGEFSINRKLMLGQTYYEIRILILPGSVYVKNAPTELRTSVRSDFESRIERHPNFITNRNSVISLPPPR